jgi:hypothetical protein
MAPPQNHFRCLQTNIRQGDAERVRRGRETAKRARPNTWRGVLINPDWARLDLTPTHAIDRDTQCSHARGTHSFLEDCRRDDTGTPATSVTGPTLCRVHRTTISDC